jgi:hypothetical protein
VKESSEKDPKIQPIQQTTHQPLFVFECVINALHEDFLWGSKLISDIVILKAQFTSVYVFCREPFDQARFMNILEGALAFANLLEELFIVLESWVGVLDDHIPALIKNVCIIIVINIYVYVVL